ASPKAHAAGSLVRRRASRAARAASWVAEAAYARARLAFSFMGLLLCPAAFPARGGGSGGRPSPFPARDTFIALCGQKGKITNAVVFASFGIRAKRASPPY